MIPLLWKKADDAIEVLINGGTMKLGPCTITREKITLPNGMALHYPGATRDASGQSWYTYRGVAKNLWGGIIVENIVQALARIILVDAELRLARAGYKAAMSVHDELIYCVPDHQVTKFATALELALTRKVEWLPNLPLAADVNSGQRYSEAK
jgi:DNA polymerase